MVDYAVVVNNLSVQFGDFYAVNDISFSVKPGEIFGFLGANGAGKTSTIRVLCGILHPSAGSVQVEGAAFKRNSSIEAEMTIKHKVGYMSQKFTLYNDLTVEENLSFMASLRSLTSKVYLQRRDYLLNFISFDQPLNSMVRDLPGGIKQQVSLAASILHDPSIIFLDEPTAGVTPLMRARFWDLIRELASSGKTVFVTTHYMDEAEQCERIALMRSAKIIALGTPMELKNETFPQKLYGLESKKPVTYPQIKALQVNPLLDYFEPFGLRFHAAFQDSVEGRKFREVLGLDFNIQEILPSLEDVFIRRVETKSTGHENEGKQS